MSLWFRRFDKSLSATSRLVCFPHAGGSASFFLPLSRALSESCEVLSVQYPGRQDRRREKQAASILGLADAIAAQISSYCDKPMVLFGHSMGATVAYEVARRIEADSSLTALVVSGRSAPIQQRRERMHLLPDGKLIEELQKLGGTNRDALANDEVIRMVLPVVRADYQIIENYQYVPGPKLSVPIYVHNGGSDSRVSIEEANLWQAHTSSTCETHVHSGGHFYLSDNTESLVTHIKRIIEANPTPL